MELIECDSGEKLLTDWRLFRYCNDPFMIQCLETDCTSGINAKSSVLVLVDCNNLKLFHSADSGLHLLTDLSDIDQRVKILSFKTSDITPPTLLR